MLFLSLQSAYYFKSSQNFTASVRVIFFSGKSEQKEHYLKNVFKEGIKNMDSFTRESRNLYAASMYLPLLFSIFLMCISIHLFTTTVATDRAYPAYMCLKE